MSQLELGLRSGVSTKHLSYVETGRAQPSREMILHLAEQLDVPIRERNGLLLAAGYAPRYTETSLADDTMTAVRVAIDMTLEHHEPFPAIVIDRHWNLVTANRSAAFLTTGIDAYLMTPTPNIIRIALHPRGLARHVRNLTEYSTHLLERLRRQVAQSADPALAALLNEVSNYPNLAKPPEPTTTPPGVVLPMILDIDGHPLSLFTTIATFGTPLDITTAELAIETFYPADPSTEDWLRHQAH
jgi:hypothetical protein